MSRTRRRSWTKKEDKIILASEGKITDTELSKKIYRSPKSISVRRNYLKKKYDPVQREKDLEYIATFFKLDGQTQISAALDLTSTIVEEHYNYLKDNDLVEEYRNRYWKNWNDYEE